MEPYLLLIFLNQHLIDLFFFQNILLKFILTYFGNFNLPGNLKQVVTPDIVADTK